MVMDSRVLGVPGVAADADVRLPTGFVTEIPATEDWS
jgi:hypothetical protein